MGKRKNSNPRRNAGTLGDTEQLGAQTAAEEIFRFAADTSHLALEEDYDHDEECHLPPKKKRACQSKNDELMHVPPVAIAVEQPQHVNPEVTIEPSAVSDRETDWNILVHKENEIYVPCESEWILRGYRLIRTRLVTQNSLEGKGITMCTSSGASTLLKHCESCCCPESFRSFTAVSKAIEDGTLQLDCVGHGLSLEVMISLTERAFQMCSAERLPLHKCTLSKKYQAATNLHHALSELFPDTIIADVMSTREHTKPISAKTVYNLIDNVKLRDYEANGGYDSKPMHIPGLVPTLRPYQDAAVKWMLQREQCPRENNEWELSWVVLIDPRNRDEVNHNKEESMLVIKRDVVSLYEWKRLAEGKELESGVLFCPFVGLLAKSGLEARMSTIDSFIGSGDGCEWANSTGGILADSMGLGKTVEVR